MNKRNWCVIAATCVVILLAIPCMAAEQSWAKVTAEIKVDGDIHGTWSKIFTSDSGPHRSRLLYQDMDEDLLVIRHSVEDQRTSVEYLATGEELFFDFVDDPYRILTITYGTNAVDINFGEVEGEFGIDGTEFPQSLITAGQALIANASTAFQDALFRLAKVGCYDTFEIYDVVVPYAHIFYNDVDCKSVPSNHPGIKDIVHDFDPRVNPPDAFEEQFGQAYYQ
jgi:hypothetical protein